MAGGEARSPGKEGARVVGFGGGDWLGFIRRTGWHSVRRERDFGTDGRGGVVVSVLYGARAEGFG
jgi:hypothetical protein